MVTLIQGIASFYPDLYNRDANDAMNDPVGAFLKESFTVEYAKKLKTYDYWGPGNPPLYVSQVNYGRMIVISVEESRRNLDIYAKLKAGGSSSSGKL